MRWHLISTLLLLAACGGEQTEVKPSAAAAGVGAPPTALFIERAQETGLDFQHESGAAGEYNFPEINGAGVALFDADNDGDLDLYLVHSAPFPRRSGQLTDRLYRNDLTRGADGQAKLRFVEITKDSGITPQGYGMGVATGDFDNDGWIDLYLTNYGPDQLLRNRGVGDNGKITFEDVTAKRHPGNGRWSISASFVDLDRDGWLDLYVANYVSFDPMTQIRCRNSLGGPDYCGPLGFASEPDSLFRNRGDGTFEDASHIVGIAEKVGNGLGVIAADFDGDGWTDLYVANDQQPNHLWRHRGTDELHFENSALLAGVGLNREGKAEASMGVDAGDIDGDGDLDLFLTHLNGETNTLYTNQGEGLFGDSTISLGLAIPSRPWTGFGTGFFDFDGDGWLDLFVGNGAVTAREDLLVGKDPFPFHQPNQLYRNLEGQGFEDVTDSGGAAFELSEVTRGAAFGDLDNDGDTDIVLLNNRGPVRLLLNEVGQRNPWLGLRLLDAKGRRDQLGAEVEVVLPGGRTLWRRVHTDGSYASANDPRVLVGLGTASGIQEVKVRWPDGQRESFNALAPGRYHTVLQGTGITLERLPGTTTP